MVVVTVCKWRIRIGVHTERERESIRSSLLMRCSVRQYAASLLILLDVLWDGWMYA